MWSTFTTRQAAVPATLLHTADGRIILSPFGWLRAPRGCLKR